MRLTKKQTKTLEEALTAPLLASTEELRGRAHEWLTEWYRDDEIGLPSPEAINSLTALLEQIAAEARLAEAKKWLGNWNVHEEIRSFVPWATKRLKELEAALAKQSGRTGT